MSKTGTDPRIIFSQHNQQRVELKSTNPKSYPVKHLPAGFAQDHQQFSQNLKQQEQSQCPVCLTSALKMRMVRFSAMCLHYSCNPCLQQHIKHQLKNFKTINCLNYKCKQTVDQSSKIYRKMSLEQKEKYYKILINNAVNKLSNRRSCPKEECLGYYITDQIPVVCVVCGQQFCPKCSLNKHKGECDQNGVNYLVSNLMFKKCEKCKMVVQKNQGCNHMTCRCGYQFCYDCGQIWSNGHLCNRPLPNQRPNALSNQSPNHIQRPISSQARAQPHPGIQFQSTVLQRQRILRAGAVNEGAASQINLVRGQEIQPMQNLQFRQNIEPGQNVNEQNRGRLEQRQNCCSLRCRKIAYIFLLPIDIVTIICSSVHYFQVFLFLLAFIMVKAAFYTSFKVIATQFGKSEQYNCYRVLKIVVLMIWVPAWILGIIIQFEQATGVIRWFYQNMVFLTVYQILFHQMQ